VSGEECIERLGKGVKIFFPKPITFLMRIAKDSSSSMKIGKHTKSMPAFSRKMRGATTERNEWHGTLGRFNALLDEVNRALGRSTNFE
jgi:hypothetical protein